MKEKRYGTLGGLEVPVQVYTDFSEADKAAGKPNVLLDIANDNLHYRGGPAAATREFVCELLEKKTGIKPKVKKTDKTTKDESGKDVPVFEWDESEGEYVRRVMAEKTWESLKQFQPDVDAWAKQAYSEVDDKGKVTKVLPLAVDAAAPERKPKAPPKLSEEDKALALEFVEGKKSLSKFTAAAAKYSIVVPAVTDDKAKSVEAIGWSVKAYFKAKRDEAAALAKAAF